MCIMSKSLDYVDLKRICAIVVSLATTVIVVNNILCNNTRRASYSTMPWVHKSIEDIFSELE